MSSVSSSSSVDSSLGDDVGNLALFDIETLLLSVGFEVVEKSDNMLDRLLWESTIVMVDVFAHSMSSWATSVSSEWNDRLVFENSLEVSNGLKEVETFAGSGSLGGVLVMSSQVINSAFSGYSIKIDELNTKI